MSRVAGSVLVRYQGADAGRWAVGGGRCRWWGGVQGVPDDQQAVAEQSECNGAFDRLGDPVAGLSDTEDVAAVTELVD